MNFFKQIKHSIIYNIKLRLCCSLPSLKYLKQQNTSFIHPIGICISKEVVIGKNCTIAQNVTIGNSFSSNDKFNFPQIGNNVTIYANSVVYGGVTIGDKCLIYPNVTIYQGCKLGKNVTIHAGSVIGADGCGFAPNTEGYDKIPQIGIVVIEDNVEIGANTCIDRSTMGQTVIHQGVKLDNLIQVAHNCEIGENTVMSAQVGLAGSTKIGAWCMVGGQAGFAGHIHVADKTFVGAQCGVISNTKGNGEQLIGSPAVNPKMYFKARAIDSKLPDMYRQIAQLQRQIEELKKCRN